MFDIQKIIVGKKETFGLVAPLLDNFSYEFKHLDDKVSFHTLDGEILEVAAESIDYTKEYYLNDFDKNTKSLILELTDILKTIYSKELELIEFKNKINEISNDIKKETKKLYSSIELNLSKQGFLDEDDFLESLDFKNEHFYGFYLECDNTCINSICLSKDYDLNYTYKDKKACLKKYDFLFQGALGFNPIEDIPENLTDQLAEIKKNNFFNFSSSDILGNKIKKTFFFYSQGANFKMSHDIEIILNDKIELKKENISMVNNLLKELFN